MVFRLDQEEENAKKWAALPELKKNFYKEHPEVTNMPAERVAAIREENNNTSVDRLFLEEAAAGEPIPNPIENFEQCFSEYPDLLSTFFPGDFCRRARGNCCFSFR